MSTKAQSLQEVCDVALAGFDRTLYGYKGNVQYATFQPPPEILKQLPEFKVDDAKERWVPIRTDAKLDRVAVKKRHHIVREPDWEPPVKKPKYFFPPSKGVKLRSVAELNQEQQETKNMSSEEYDAYRRRKNIEKERSLSHSLVNKPAPPPAPVDPVQAILNDIKAASQPRAQSAHSSTNTNNADNSNHKGSNNNVNSLSSSSNSSAISSSSAPPTSSTVRKDRRLVNALRTKKDERLFKKPAPAPPAQRKGSSSSTSSGSTSATRHTVGKRPFPVPAIHKRPCLNLLALKSHLTDDKQDEPALRKIADLMKRKKGNHVAINITKRPKLMLHLPKPRRVEKVTMLGKYKVRARSTSEPKTVKPKDAKQARSRSGVVESSHVDSKPVAVETKPKLSEKSTDQKLVISNSTKSKSNAPTVKPNASITHDSSAKLPASKPHESKSRTLKSTKEISAAPAAGTVVKNETSTAAPAAHAGNEKLKALTGTVTADFLKTIKIAKRKPKIEPLTTAEPGELEEGETISPSPSPTHSNARQIPPPPSPPPPPPPPAAPAPPPPPPPLPLSVPPVHGPTDRSRERSRSPSRSRREGRPRHEEENKKDTRRSTRDDSDRKRPSERRDEEDGSGSISSKKENGGRYRDHSIDDRRRHRRDSRQSSDDRHRHRSRSPSRSHGRSRSAGRRSRSPRRRSSNISRTRSRSPSRPSGTATAVAAAITAPPPPLSQPSVPAPAPLPATASAPALPKPVYKNATSPDAESDGQCRVYALMFRKLATAYKHRGDPKLSNIEGQLDHIQALLNYVLSFYYQDLGTTEYHGFRHWESLIPFTGPLFKHLSSRKDLELYAICSRMMGMVRYYTFARRVPMVSKKLDNLISDRPQDKPPGEATLATETAKASKQAFADFEEACKSFREADRYLNYEQFRRSFPMTFNNACLDGEYGPGIVIGGEAGTSIEPQYPFMPFTKLHHAAIVSKCLLVEYIEKHGLRYNPIQETDEYM